MTNLGLRLDSEENSKSLVVEILMKFNHWVRSAGLPTYLSEKIFDLIEQTDQPCTIAVAGRVKTGKSTFINTLLGCDISPVGKNETTATVLYFRYGKPDFPERPIRAHHWDGRVTYHSLDYLAHLQSNKDLILKESESISYLEYALEIPFLKRIALVDTPGLGSAVSEHQKRIAKLVRLPGLAYENVNDATINDIGDKPINIDAIIYLLEFAALEDDEKFLREFNDLMSGNVFASNVLGVVTMVDKLATRISGDIRKKLKSLDTRTDRSLKLAQNLRGHLNTVVPISAELERLVRFYSLRNNRSKFEKFVNTIREINPEHLEELLSEVEIYKDREIYAETFEKRKSVLREEFQWGAFVTAALIASRSDQTEKEILAVLEATSGFAELKNTVYKHFELRSQHIRLFRIIYDARNWLNEIRDQYGKWLFAHHRLELISELFSIDQDLSKLYHHLLEANIDFNSLQRLEANLDLFNDQEILELRALFGAYGLDSNSRLQNVPSDKTLGYVEENQNLWMRKRWVSHPLKRALAERAVENYAKLLAVALNN